jgi:hypothetical protein
VKLAERTCFGLATVRPAGALALSRRASPNYTGKYREFESFVAEFVFSGENSERTASREIEIVCARALNHEEYLVSITVASAG